jgi:hypothetical protein
MKLLQWPGGTMTMSSLVRYPITLLFLVSSIPLVVFIRPGPDRAMPEVLQWLMMPAYLLTFFVSVVGLRRPVSLIVALLVCVMLDYLLWTVLLHRRNT